MSVPQLWRLGVPTPGVLRNYPPNPIYVDSVNGTSSGTGAIDKPVNTLSLALGLCAGLPDYEIKIIAPETSPLRQEITFNTSLDVTLSGVDSEPWYIYGSNLHTSGWSGAGPIYSKTLGYTSVLVVVVTTMTETIVDREFNVKLIQNTDTPTTPAAGQYGYVNGVIYVRLPDDSNPALHSIEISQRNFCVATIGFGLLTVNDCVARNSMINGISNGNSTQPENTGFLTVNNSLVEYCANGGVGATGRNERTICNNVKCYRIGNDGFNLHNPTGGEGYMELNGCEGSYCGDIAGQSAQGASNHETSHMVQNGGSYNKNVSGAMVVINSGICDIHGDTLYGPVVMDGNMRLGNTAGTIANQAGCNWEDTSSGIVTGDVTVKNGLGIGVKRDPGAVVTGIELIKSINNAFPDIL
ncbi:hypothetical protein [Martelella alba]|uniref:Uncharacterized protein n=1 Tax=Martelella alba TaxID=2590451 RepID=A0ABY2SDC9_9HYPH|nr:hypothetical protein [Martelella alba]TKI02389.1 hypothetical protein FCN80_25175 [Martelella alba]